MEAEPRQHHYRFAHRYLARVAFRSPDGLQHELRTRGDRWLTDAWRTVGADLPRKERLKPTGLEVTWAGHATNDLAVISLPEPTASAEAHLVGILFGALLPEVYTLERAEDPTTGEASTVFAAWEIDGSHLDLGPGPEPEPAAFANHIWVHLGFSAPPDPPDRR